MDLNNSDDNSLLVRFQRSMSLDPDDYPLLSSSSSSSSSCNKKRLLKSTGLSILFLLCGWYYPRCLINHESTIHTKPAPYQETASGDVILDFLLNQPLVEPATIPGTFLVFTSVWVPLILVTGYAYLCHRGGGNPPQLVEVATAISAFCMSIGLTEGSTQLLKLYVQRRRPNFYALCGFDKALKECTAPIRTIKEANFSFPSGHSSLACGGMTFLVLYFCGKWAKNSGKQPPALNNNNNNLQRRMFLTAVIPWGWAIFVGASRLVDKWHHPSDVVAGLGLGFATVCIVYHSWYPPVWSKYAGIPRPLLQDLDYSYYAIGGGSGGSGSNTPVNSGNNKLASFSD